MRHAASLWVLTRLAVWFLRDKAKIAPACLPLSLPHCSSLPVLLNSFLGGGRKLHRAGKLRLSRPGIYTLGITDSQHQLPQLRRLGIIPRRQAGVRETPPSDRRGRQLVAFTDYEIWSKERPWGKESSGWCFHRVVLKSVCGKGQNTLNTQGTRT